MVERWRREAGGEGMEEEGSYGGLIGDGVGRLGERGWRGKEKKGGGWSRIKYEITIMERVEHNTTIGHKVMNEDGIEQF